MVYYGSLLGKLEGYLGEKSLKTKKDQVNSTHPFLMVIGLKPNIFYNMQKLLPQHKFPNKGCLDIIFEGF